MEEAQAVRTLAAQLHTMDDWTLLEAVRECEKRFRRGGGEEERHGRMMDAIDVLWTERECTGSGDDVADLQWKRWERAKSKQARRAPCPVKRRGDLGWSVVRGRRGRLVRAFPGPRQRKADGYLSQLAHSMIRDRIAKEAIDWLRGWEARGGARERAERRWEARPKGPAKASSA